MDEREGERWRQRDRDQLNRIQGKVRENVTHVKGKVREREE